MKWLQRFRTYAHEISLAVLLLALLAIAARVDPAFVSVSTQQGLYSHVWDLAILSLPMTFIIISGGIDLSIGSTMALVSVTFGMTHHAAWPMGLSITTALTVGLTCGLINGLFIIWTRVHPLIITLATFSAYRGLAEGISQAKIYSGFPDWFQSLGSDALGANSAHPRLYHLQLAGWFFIAAAIFSATLLAKSPFGRSIQAIGFNETAARYSGIRIDRIKLALYAASGFLAGLVSINYSAHRNTANAGVGSQMELDVITAVVLGGASIFGGHGRITGTILGVLLIHETREFVPWYFERGELVPVAVGTLLIVSVAANALLNRRAARI